LLLSFPATGYWEVGKELARAGSPNSLYARWIGTYGSPEFGAVVRAVLEATNEVAAELGGVERAAMRRHFRTTSRYEWMFWDMGYRCEQWPFEDVSATPRRPGR
jgi:thiaminase/transcriptional activator TenA